MWPAFGELMNRVFRADWPPPYRKRYAGMTSKKKKKDNQGGLADVPDVHEDLLQVVGRY